MNGKGILIVEDENIVALDMKIRLESLGYRVLGVVDNGAAALDFLASSLPDLVLMDIKLKGGSDGIETARIARERVDVPIIFVTAFTDETTLERAKIASPYGYIVKPFHERELRIAIELALYKFRYELSMRRSKEVAEEANRMKSEFLANVSHELKTPLNSVIGFTELSLDQAVDEEQREYLSTVLRSARSLVTLIDSILDFSRLENGRLAPVAAPFSLDGLLGECVEFLAIAATSRGLDVSFRRDAALPEFIVCDRGRVRQILMNLLDNAVKFTEHGRVRLVATLSQREGEHGAAADGLGFVLRLVVEDTGIGMAPEKISKAFERFTQLDGSSTRPAGGTGLGLAIVSKSVELLGGSISVQSAPRQGSRFEVLLPVSADESSRSGAEKPLVGKTVAVVGFDEESNADIGELLGALGAGTSFAAVLHDALGGGGLVLASEKATMADRDAVRLLRGRMIAACRPGFVARSDIAADGCAIIPSPVRARPLLDAVAGLERCAPSANAKASPPREPDMKPEGSTEPASLSERGKSELKRYLQTLETAVAVHDQGGAERDSKEYKDLFLVVEAEACEKLAFTALLCARKGDWNGLGEIIQKGWGMLGAEEPRHGGGGMVNAFLGR